MALPLLSRTVEHELTLELSLGRGWLRLAFLALYLACPNLAATGENASQAANLANFDFYAVPSGGGGKLLVTGMTRLGRSVPQSASAVLIPNPTATPNSFVGMGFSSPSGASRLVHVNGNVRAGGCFWIGSTPRCTWY